MSNIPAPLSDENWAEKLAQATPDERIKLETFLMEWTTDPHFPRDVPRFMLALPFGGDPDEIAWRMAGRTLTSLDPDATADNTGSIASKDLVAKAITVWDMFSMPADEGNGCGAYLLLDVTVDGDDEHIRVNTGAPQAITRLARAWLDGALPIRGSFSEIPGTGKRGNPAITFIAEPPPW